MTKVSLIPRLQAPGVQIQPNRRRRKPESRLSISKSVMTVLSCRIVMALVSPMMGGRWTMRMGPPKPAISSMTLALPSWRSRKLSIALEAAVMSALMRSSSVATVMPRRALTVASVVRSPLVPGGSTGGGTRTVMLPVRLTRVSAQAQQPVGSHPPGVSRSSTVDRATQRSMSSHRIIAGLPSVLP